MGEPKLKLRPDAAKTSGRYPTGVLEDPEPITQRFAHAAELRRAALRPADRPRVSQLADSLAATRAATASTVRGWLFQPRLLVAGLGLAALVPCLILAALWLGSTSEGEPAGVAPVPELQAETSAVLTAPDRIEAVAGEHLSFPIALDGTDGVPPRSIVAIKGQPQGSNFSEGRPYGESEWNLRPDQIGDLKLWLPAGASGKFKLGIALIAPDDKVIAETATLLEIAPPPAPAEQAASDEGSMLWPDGSEAVASAAVPDRSEITALAPVPDAGLGDAAGMTEEPAATAAAATPPVESPSEEDEQSMETATAPSGDAQPDTAVQSQDSETGTGSVEPAVFVNMRGAPSSSSPVLGVVAKGAKLPVLDRKRGWVQVTDPATGKTGWIYSGLLVGEAKANQRVRRVAPAEPEPQSESLWGRLGRWLSPSQEKPSAN